MIVEDLEITNAMTPDKKPTQNYCRTGMSLEEIQQNKKIVDVLLTSYKHDYDNPGFPVGESASAYTRWIIKEATGKDIEDL